ncbi:hypothetical protein E2562_004643 [Oryza meyeriana var. granulata]|uniref:DUF4283 domain-containing protein n=1 Tax=Oryza meyeriana var. granulata TaxID=110450 RepID=A0A6G1DDS5_9ORYZ|nr:hypothetical protein E2562_004643 [Oryza meyeriana var. granulata]
MQLARVVSAKWKWEPKEQEENSFVVLFPSKMELQGPIAYGGADVKGQGMATGVRLQFEEWIEKKEGFLLPKLIPRNLNVVIGDHYFELNNEVERMGFDENGEEVEVEQGGEDGDDEKEEYGKDERDERDSKSSKNDDMVIDGKEDGGINGKSDTKGNENQGWGRMISPI